MKDKISLEDAFEQKIQETAQDDSKEEKKIRQDAVEALVALGYSQTEALKAVRSIDITVDMTVEQVLKIGLKNVML